MKKDERKYFAFFNAEEAKPLIGQKIEAIDNHTTKYWRQSILTAINVNSSLPFSTTDGYSWSFIRTLPTKPDHSGLIAALDKSILQWQMMKETGRSKHDCHIFLGGTNNKDCFLCVYNKFDGKNSSTTCINCIKWTPNFENTGAWCEQFDSPYRTWRFNQTKESIQQVLDKMLSERERLLKEMEE